MHYDAHEFDIHLRLRELFSYLSGIFSCGVSDGSAHVCVSLGHPAELISAEKQARRQRKMSRQ